MENTPVQERNTRYVNDYNRHKARALALALANHLRASDLGNSGWQDALADLEIELACDLGFDDPETAYADQALPLRVVIMGDIDADGEPRERNANQILAEAQEIPELTAVLHRLIHDTACAFVASPTAKVPAEVEKVLEYLERDIPDIWVWVTDIASDYAGEAKAVIDGYTGRK